MNWAVLNSLVTFAVENLPHVSDDERQVAREVGRRALGGSKPPGWGLLAEPGELDARLELAHALGRDWSIELANDHDDGDQLALRGPRGAFIVEADDLRQRWEPA